MDHDQAGPGGSYRVEAMTAADREPVIDLLNHYVVGSFAAFPLRPMPYAFFDLFLRAAETHPALTARAVDGAFAGFAMLRPYHFAESFAATAEISYFLAPEHTRRGLGSLLLDRLGAAGAAMGVTRLLAQISSLNQPSLDFHARHGFVQSGRLAGIGRKFDRDFDVIWMQKAVEAA